MFGKPGSRRAPGRRSLAGLVSLLLLSAGLSSWAATSPIDHAISQMSLAEKVGQLVMIRVHGTSLSTAERDLIVGWHIGGTILFADNYASRDQLRALTARIQKAGRAGNRLGIGMLISTDQEGGRVKRFPGPPWYSAARMGEIGKASVAYDQGSRTGGFLRSLGVNMDLAPVADLDVGPSHIMARRSFGRTPSRVARLSKAFARGLQSRRVAATLKHFPGLGAAVVNSDDGRAYVYRRPSRLVAEDLVPFQSGVEAGVKAVMVGHGIYVHFGGRLPASVNPTIAQGWLRTRLGFGGVAISDSLNAIAWRFDGSVPKACVATIKAGIDVALVTGGIHTAKRCVSAIHQAAVEGRIGAARLNDAVRRILTLKQWLGVYAPAPVPAPPSPDPRPTPTTTPEPTPSEAPTEAPAPSPTSTPEATPETDPDVPYR